MHCRVASLAVVLQTAVAVVAFLIARACLRAQMQQRFLIAAMRGVVVEGGCVCAVIWSSRFLQPRLTVRKHGAATSCEDSPAVDASAPSHHVFSGVGPGMYASCGLWLPHQHAAYSMATSRAAVCCSPQSGQ